MSILRCVGKRLMLPTQPLRGITSVRALSDKPVATSEAKDADPLTVLKEGRNHKVDNLEKRFLVWSGKYKSLNDVPSTVPQETMEKARNKARIKIANYMILGTMIACIGFVYSGKQAAKRGESVQKMNIDWHKKYEDETSKE